MSLSLDQAEIERLALVNEECAEVMHIISKILRFGFYSRHPSGGPTNKELLEGELGDLQARINLMIDAGDIDTANINSHCMVKMESKQYLLHQD
jgi:hypothetical protein